MIDPSLIMTAQAYIDGTFENPTGVVRLRLGEFEIEMSQLGKDMDGDDFDHEITIHTEQQAISIIRAISAMSAALGWKV
jgi:hypothetical protein